MEKGRVGDEFYQGLYALHRGMLFFLLWPLYSGRFLASCGFAVSMCVAFDSHGLTVSVALRGAGWILIVSCSIYMDCVDGLTFDLRVWMSLQVVVICIAFWLLWFVHCSCGMVVFWSSLFV